MMNEVALHQGSSPHLGANGAFVDGQHLTEAAVNTAIGKIVVAGYGYVVSG
jgi:hypothetical protein